MSPPTPSYGKLALALFVVLVGVILWHIDTPRLPRPLAQPTTIVILVTVDGVRPDELLMGIDPLLSELADTASAMPYTMGVLAPKGVFLGDFRRENRFTLGNPMGISFPSYQSIFSGRPTFCVRNECRPQLGRTLVHDILDSRPGTVPLIGFFSYYDRVCDSAKIAPGDGTVMCAANEIERNDGPPPVWSDQTVFETALEFLQSETPDFLYIGLGESDSIGHRGDYPGYLNTLAMYDGFFKQLDAEIVRLAAAGEHVSLIVTTDHGRGQGDEWTEHRWNVPGTDRLWLLASGYGIAQKGAIAGGRERSLYDIRATVQYLMGLKPPSGIWQGTIMTELLQSPEP